MSSISSNNPINSNNLRITVSLNGESQEIVADTPLSSAIEKWGYQCGNGQTLFAIAINDAFIPRPQYGETLLQAGDRIDVVSPMQGG